jgi:hypothetical protein
MAIAASMIGLWLIDHWTAGRPRPEPWSISVALALAFLAQSLQHRAAAQPVPAEPRVRSRNRSDIIRTRIELPDIESMPLMILRKNGDEATGALAGSHFFAWMINLVWLRITKTIERPFGIVGEQLDEVSSHLPRFADWRFWVWALPLSAFGAYRAAITTGTLRAVLGVTVISLILYPVVVVFAIFALVFAYWIVLGVALVPLAFVLAILMLPFGPEAVWFSLFVDISAEVAPSGSWVVHQLSDDNEPDEEKEESSPMGLKHSAPYDDPRALAMIARWIVASDAGS